jgi:multiple sugar transport system permease protein
VNRTEGERLGQGLKARGKGPERWKRFSRSETILALVLVLPTVLWVLSIVIYPVVANFALSLGASSLNDLGSATLNLYRTELSSSATWQQLWRTVIWTGGNLVLIVPVGLGIALLLNQDLKGLRHVRMWILLPWMFPVIVVVLIWRWLLDVNLGVVNYVLQGTGLVEGRIDFLSQDLAMLTVILANAWRWIPFVAVVLLAALQNVSKELHEAAATDGANAIHRFRYITLPHILPALAINTFLLMMWLFNMFPPIWLMTRGGPNEATTTLPIALYHIAFERFEMERGAVLAVILFAFVVAFSVVYWVLARSQLKGGR